MNFNLKKLARAAIPDGLVARSRRLIEKLDPFVHLSYSQDGEDMILRRLFEGQRSGFYVDVGAHHPFRFSNTCYFHRKGWTGINVDPNPDAIAAFERARPFDINVCVGIAAVPGELNYHIFNEPALNTFDANLAAERALLPDYRLIEKRGVPVRRLDDLLVEYLPSGRRIDFLSIDVEGLDLAVLRSGNWKRFRPRVLLVEARERSAAALAGDPIHAFAQAVDYQLVGKTLNTLIYEDGLSMSDSRPPT
jgi:FkbM family methyltransferase